MIRRPAIGQSDATKSGSFSPIRANTGLPIFIESAKNSALIPYVPSWPAQRSTVFTSVPGTHCSASRVFWPTFCTREWHGMW